MRTEPWRIERERLCHQHKNLRLSVELETRTLALISANFIRLLELGYEDFVRVGSMRKISKPVLPYSVHSTGSQSQELKELQDILKGDLMPSEKM